MIDKTQGPIMLMHTLSRHYSYGSFLLISQTTTCFDVQMEVYGVDLLISALQA